MPMTVRMYECGTCRRSHRPRTNSLNLICKIYLFFKISPKIMRTNGGLKLFRGRHKHTAEGLLVWSRGGIYTNLISKQFEISLPAKPQNTAHQPTNQHHGRIPIRIRQPNFIFEKVQLPQRKSFLFKHLKGFRLSFSIDTHVIAAISSMSVHACAAERERKGMTLW